MHDGNVLVLSDYAGGEGSDTGGAGFAVMNSFRALQSAGARVKLLSGFDLPDSLLQDDDIASLGGADLRRASRTAALSLIHNPQSRSSLAEALGGMDPRETVVILHQWTRYLTPSAIALLRPFPLMVFMHDYFWACPNGAYFDFREVEPCTRTPGGPACIVAQCDRGGYLHKLVRLARHGALTLAARDNDYERVHLHISEAARRTARPLLPEGRHEVIYNPMVLDPNAAPGGGDRRYDIGYFGRLEPEKGIVRLLRRLAALGMTGLFVGEGSLAQVIERTPGMTRLPWQPQGDVSLLMRHCGAVALPSLWHETWGLITPEAMAAGVPALVSTRAGSSELVQRFGGGVVFDPDDEEQLDQALIQLKSRQSVQPLSPAGREGLRDLLSPQRHAAQIREFAQAAWQIDIGGRDQAFPTADADRPVTSRPAPL